MQTNANVLTFKLYIHLNSDFSPLFVEQFFILHFETMIKFVYADTQSAIDLLLNKTENKSVQCQLILVIWS